MNPTLNSPKYADPKSLAFQMYKKQQDRKQRINPYVPQLEQRYFRRNEGTTDYATIPEVTLTGDFVIEFDVLLTRDSDRILGTSLFVDGRFFVRLPEGSNSVLQIGVFGSITESIETPTGFISQNVLSKISISRTGSSVTIANETNGEVFTDPDFTSTPFVISKAFGHLSNNMQGILANLKIYDNGTLVRDYPLNDNLSTIRDLANGQDGTIINGNASDWGLFDRQADGDWKGNGLIVPPWDSVDQVLVTA